ncbi:hypothetical protein HOG98_08445 [bacterium]|jgi:hypothetical protein|nr:hypothetical protein [bacterium]
MKKNLSSEGLNSLHNELTIPKTSVTQDAGINKPNYYDSTGNKSRFT